MIRRIIQIDEDKCNGCGACAKTGKGCFRGDVVNEFIEKAKDFPDLNEIKTVVINSKSLSKFLGQKRSNVKKLNELGYNFSVCFDDSLQKYELYLK